MRFTNSRSVAKFATTVALAGTIGLAGGGGAMAQQATPAVGEATPVGGALDPSQCETPASPVIATGAADAMASPVAGEVDLEVTEVEDEATVAEVTSAIENLYACYNAGDGVSYVLLLTDNAIRANYGDVTRDQLAGMISEISDDAPANELEMLNVFDLDGQLAAEYQVTLGHQVWNLLDVLVEQDGTWVVDDTYYGAPLTDLDSTTVAVQGTVEDGGITIEVSPQPVMNQPAVRMQLDIEGDGPMYFALLQGGDAASLEELDLANLPEGVTFIGEEVATPGDRVEALFEGLPEGEYVIYMEAEGGATGTFDLTIDPPFDPEA